MKKPTRGGNLSATHNLLTDAWTGTVKTLETAVERFNADRALTNECKIVFFEVAGHHPLHVNVTHRYQTKEIRGWAGPGAVPTGFVHNRTFDEAHTSQMVRQIREMVYATRI
jgi:hypothetical protein